MTESAPNLRRDAVLVGAANLLSRVTGLLREMAFAALFGASMAADAYNAAFRIGNLMRELFAEGALSNAFVPLYARVSEQEGDASAWRLANAFLGILLALVGALTLLTAAFAEPLVWLVASGFSADPEKVALTASLTRILSPFVATLAIASVWMGMLNVRGRFFGPAASPVLFNIAVIATCLGAPTIRTHLGISAIYAVAWASLLGGAAQAAFQIPSLYRAGYRPWPRLGGHPALRSLLAFVGPAVVAISVVQIHLLIETQLASREGDGPVSWLLYAFRIAHLPFSIVSGALAVASLAGLSVHAARGDNDAFRRDLAGALNLNTFLLLPAAVVLLISADSWVALFFQRGAFTAADTAATAGLLRAYAVALLAIGAQRILVPVYYTLNDPRTPMWVGLGAVGLKLPVALALMSRVGLPGIPLSHAVLASMEVLALLLLLQRRVGGLGRALAGDHLRTFAAAGVMTLAMLGLQSAFGARSSTAPGALALAAASGGIYLGVAELLGLREGRKVLARLLRRKRGLPPSIDAETRDALARCAKQAIGVPQFLHGELSLPTGAGTLTMRRVDNAIEARLTPSLPVEGPAGRLVAVLGVGQGPPRLIGLIIEGESSFSVCIGEGGLTEGLAAGVRIEVDAPA